MIAPDFVTRGVAAPTDDTLVSLFETAVDRDCYCNVARTDGTWYVALFQIKPRAFVYAQADRLDDAIRDALAKLPKEAARA